jgi:hypothetical protein
LETGSSVTVGAKPALCLNPSLKFWLACDVPSAVTVADVAVKLSAVAAKQLSAPKLVTKSLSEAVDGRRSGGGNMFGRDACWPAGPAGGLGSVTPFNDSGFPAFGDVSAVEAGVEGSTFATRLSPPGNARLVTSGDLSPVWAGSDGSTFDALSLLSGDLGPAIFGDLSPACAGVEGSTFDACLSTLGITGTGVSRDLSPVCAGIEGSTLAT